MSGNFKKLRFALFAATLTMSANGFAQTVIKGNVTDNTGEPIIGASVIEDGYIAYRPYKRHCSMNSINIYNESTDHKGVPEFIEDEALTTIIVKTLTSLDVGESTTS